MNLEHRLLMLLGNKSKSKEEIMVELGITKNEFSKARRNLAFDGIRVGYNRQEKGYEIQGNIVGINPDERKLLAEVERRGLTGDELSAVLDQVTNPEIVVNEVDHFWGDTHAKIGLLGDTHIGSKYTDYSMLEDLVKRFKKDGVDAVYHCGDMTEGYDRRKGQSFEVELHGADAQINGVVERFPDFGVPIYFITGDHDSWHMDNGGIDVGKHIDEARPDMHYLGQFSATINLTAETDLMLQHPAKGTAYALSYQVQKMIEAFSGGEKPRILGVGHYHKIEYMFYRNVHAFQTGCIQSQTPWMKRMNLAAHKGAWLLNVFTKRDGEIDKLEMKLFPYYK